MKLKLLSVTSMMLYANLASAQPAKAKAPKVAPPPVEESDDENDEEEDSDESPTTDKATSNPEKTTTDKASAKPAPAAPPTMLSQKLAGRLSLGTSLGLSKVKPKEGSWQGSGVSSLYAYWRSSSKPGGKLHWTARYTPYVGVLEIDRRHYDTTMHGVFVGMNYQTSWGFAGSLWRFGLEGGYLKAYARPQDGETADGKATAGKAAAIVSTEMTWTVLEKVQLGPYLSFAAGGVQVAQGGVATAFQF